MADAGKTPLDILFLGSGNVYAAEGRAFSSFILNGRYLFDAGPTVLQQLRRGGVRPDDIHVVFVSHFHGDHFFGLPFLFLDAWHEGRTRDIVIAGPPGIEERSEKLMDLGFPRLPKTFPALPKTTRGYHRRYIEVQDGMEAEAAGLQFTAAQVEHAPGLECFAYQVRQGGRTLTYSGDTKLCEPLLRLIAGAEVVVMECSNMGDPVHMSRRDLDEARSHARPGTKIILTHLDGRQGKPGEDGLLMASDLAHFRL